MAYSRDLRCRVLGMIEDGASNNAAARHFQVAVSTANRWVREYRETGRVEARKTRSRPCKLDAHERFLLDLIEERVDITLDETHQVLLERGIEVSYGTIWNFFDKRNISFKKNRARQ